jgi:hypothetical protein
MSFAIKVLACFDNLDIDALAELCHDDFVHVDDYEMKSRDEWLDDIKQQWKNAEPKGGINFRRGRKILVDQDDIFAVEFISERDGRNYRITNVGLKRDGKFWRFQINRVPI